jgi:peptidoglycan/xylan/chitin deacetylase (PgdA/CDA1 family)
MRFATPQGFNSGEQFFCYLKDTFDCLLKEGLAGSPKMMSVGLHCRLVGRPGRAVALERFLDYVASHGKQARRRRRRLVLFVPPLTLCSQAWVARRIDIARHWRKVNPPPA